MKPLVRLCEHCGSIFDVSPRERNPRKWCSRSCREKAKRLLPPPPSKRGSCASCGGIMWRGATSLPDGQATCLPCRRERRSRVPAPAADVLVSKTCPVCGDVFEHYSRKRKSYCSPACKAARRRVSVRRPTQAEKDASRIRERDRRARRQGVYGSGWVKLRRQVLSEESHCHLCGFEIDPDLQWPNPWSGTGDHVTPISAGGALLDRDNVRAAHLWCNLSKGASRERRAS